MPLALNRIFLHSDLGITIVALTMTLNCSLPSSSMVIINKWLLHSCPPFTIHGTDPQQNITTFPCGHFDPWYSPSEDNYFIPTWPLPSIELTLTVRWSLPRQWHSTGDYFIPPLPLPSMPDPDPDPKQINTSFPIHVWFLLPSAWITT